MSKTILIKEDSLQTIKEKVVDNSNIINPNDVCVNEAAPEVDEYTIGGETDSPVGGRYYHVSDGEINENSELITESTNSKKAHRETRQIIAKYMGTDENDPSVVKAESEFEANMFGEGRRTDWLIVLEPLLYTWYLQVEDINAVKDYLIYIHLHATSLSKESIVTQEYLQNHGAEKKSDLTPEQQNELATLIKPERQKLLNFINQIKQFGNFNDAKQFLDQQKKADDEASRAEQANMKINKNLNYKVYGPLSFVAAKAFGDFSYPDGKVCYTQEEDTWESDSYGNYGKRNCYVLLRNDWGYIEAVHDGSEVNNGLEGLNIHLNKDGKYYSGYDNYGLSMIFAWIDKFGNLTTSNTRWNHHANYAPGHGVDMALTELDIAKLMGAPFEQVFGVKKVDVNAYVKEKLSDPNVGLRDIFDDTYDEYHGIQAVKLGNKYNYLVHEKHPDSSDSWYLLWDKPYEEWFDNATDFNNGFAVVKLNGKRNFINQEGRIISDQWFDNVDDFNNGFAVVKLNEKYNFINQEGKIISHQWFDDANNFYDGFAVVRLNWKYNFINQEGRIISDQWFDDVNIFREGFAWVILNEKCNFINREGRIVSDQWFDNATDFNNGFAVVKLNGKRNFINQEGRIISDQWFDNVDDFKEGFAVVLLNGKRNFINQEGRLISDQWFDYAYSFREGFAVIELNGKRYKIDTNGNLTPLYESKKNKKILVSENQLKAIKENIESEVESSEVDLSSFKKKDSLVPSIWKDEDTLNSKVRLKLLDIADDFWEFVNITWVEPKGIILTGSICNFNWSKFSDIDLHLIVDFDEIDDRDDFVRDYMDAKKNEWNNEHKSLKIMDYPVELYVQNIDEMPEAGGIYDLEENKWLRKPNKDDIKPIGLNKFSIKDRAATIMTIIDDMWDVLNSTDDMYDIRQLGKDASKLWDKVKKMRKNSLSKNGEGGAGNIVYKVMRRMGYLDKIFDLRSAIYDKLNSVTEATKQYKKLITEEIVADGNAEHNPFEKRWKAERKALKDFLVNCGKIMTSKENGKQYKVYFDQSISDLIGYNYCICVQWNPIKMKPESTIYIRALDKFTNRIFHAQYDDRGKDNMRGTMDDTGYSQRFEAKRITKQMITESQESKSIAAAKKLAMQKLGYNEQEADEFVRIKLRNDIPSLRTPQGGKFILGATRMFCDGELRNANDIGNLNSTLKLVASDAHINEYDRNLNGLSCQELVQRFAKAMSDKLEAEKAEINQMVFDTPSDYEIVRIDSFEQAKEYGGYVSWCVTHDEHMFDSYTCNGINQFYFCLKNGFENVDKQPGDACPLDEYGLSMIAVSVNENGMLNTCTCRWNHENDGNDSIMDAKQVSQVIGMNFFEVFKPNNKWKELLADAMQRLANGEDPGNVFDDVYPFRDGFARVKLNRKWNFINQEGRFLSDQWFDDVHKFYDDFAMVILNRKYNFINQEGRLLSDQWFDGARDFYYGFAAVRLNDKYNFINQEGVIISDQWFDNIDDFSDGFVKVVLNGKSNFINQEGRLISDQWFGNVENFHNGFAKVIFNGKRNFINQEARIISDQWFDYAGYFSEGFVMVKLNGKMNFINQEGELLSDQWFDGARDFVNGFALVRVNGKWNFINQEGELLSDQWFDNADNFYNGFSKVKLNDKYNFINQEGRLLNDQWFDNVRDFVNGFALVRVNGKWNFINQEGRIISGQWFDYVSDFRDGFARVVLNRNMWNFINQEGVIISDQWFDNAYDFNKGFAWVELNGKMNFINQEGIIISDQWFDNVSNFGFHNGFVKVKLNGKKYKLDTNGNLTLAESRKVGKQMITEANNKKRFKRQTLNVLAQGLGLDPADPQLQSLESDFRNVYFGHLSNQEIDRVIGYEPLFAKCALDLGFPNNDYNDTEFTKYVNYLILNTKDKPNYTEIINHYKSNVSSFDDMRNVVGGEIKASKEANAEQQANMGSNINPNYQVLGPLTFDEAKRYGNRSGRAAGEDGRICYSQYEDTWLSQNYSNDNTNKCFVLLRNDWQELTGEAHDGSEVNNGLGELSQYNAYDDYGLSMIMLFINTDGELHECNVRWNHGINGVTKFGPGRSVDHALTEMDIANLMGIPFGKVFNVETFEEKKDKALTRLANGERAVDIFDGVYHLPQSRLTEVKLGNKFNFMRYLDSGEVMFPDYWFIKIEMVHNNCFMCYIDKENVMFLNWETHTLLTFDEYAESLTQRVAEGESPKELFEIVDDLGSAIAVRIGKGGRNNFCRWNIMTRKGKLLSSKWENSINVVSLPVGIEALLIKFGDKYNIFFRFGALINKPVEYWATSEPDVCHGKNNTYIRYEINGNYNAYDPITGQYIVPEGTNPWPPEQDVNHMIWKKWVNESIEANKQLITESKNSNRAHRQTRQLMAQQLGKDENDPWVIQAEQNFEQKMFDEGKRTDWMIVLEPLAYSWCLQTDDVEFIKKYLKYIYLHATSLTKEKTIAIEYLRNHGVQKKNELAPEEQQELAALIKPERQKLLNFINQVREFENFDELKSFLDKLMEEDRATAKEAQANMGSTINPNYQVLGPLTFDEAQQYGNESGRGAGISGKICYTQNPDTWLGPDYSDDDKNQCYVLLRKDWKNFDGEEHDGSEADNGLGELSEYNAYDDYGLSMIMLFINPEGELHECNVRWNHGFSDETEFGPGRDVDHALDEVDIANLMGVPFAKIFNVIPFKEKVNDAFEKLKNGDKSVAESIVSVFNDKLIINMLNKYFLTDKEYNVLLSTYFDNYSFLNSSQTLMRIFCGEKENVVNENCQLVWNHPIEEWFNSIQETFNNGYTLVEIDRYFNGNQFAGQSYNLINFNTGQLFLNEQSIDNWFRYILPGAVKMDYNKAPILVQNAYGKYSFIRATDNGFEYIIDMWLDSVGYGLNNLWDDGEIVVTKHIGEYQSKCNIFTLDGTLVYKKPIEEWPDKIKLTGLSRAIAWFGYDSYWLDKMTGELIPMY